MSDRGGLVRGAVGRAKAYDAVKPGLRVAHAMGLCLAFLFVLPATRASAAPCDASVVNEIAGEDTEPDTPKREGVVSYYAPNGNYSVDECYFATAATTRGPVKARRSGTDGSNRSMPPRPKGSPTSAHNSSKNWVVVVFTAP